jgi:hypothetical protein
VLADRDVVLARRVVAEQLAGRDNAFFGPWRFFAVSSVRDLDEDRLFLAERGEIVTVKVPRRIRFVREKQDDRTLVRAC